MANTLLSNSAAQRADAPAAKYVYQDWPKWLVNAKTGARKVFAKPEAVPEGWVTTDEYAAKRAAPAAPEAPAEPAVDPVEVTAPFELVKPADLIADATKFVSEADRNALFAEADRLGLKVFKGIKTEDLRAKVEEAMKAT